MRQVQQAVKEKRRIRNIMDSGIFIPFRLLNPLPQVPRHQGQNGGQTCTGLIMTKLIEFSWQKTGFMSITLVRWFE